jgi:dTDP-glucose 4,6-dehydratase/UDP-glucose 4-epimerase
LKILIIGSRGFIGSNIYDHFESQGDDVFSCDFLDIRNQKNYFRINPFNSDYNEILEKHHFDLVINCAGSANVGASIENPFFDFDLNVNVVSKILGAIYKTNKETKFINFSSAAVYGNPLSLPITAESAQYATPISPYGVHKRMSEILLKSYFDSFQIPTCSLRVFSAYGNGQKKLLMWDLFQKFTDNSKSKIELFGTGNETRDFIHINDILQQVKLVIKNANFNGEAINIGNGVETPISEIAQLFKDSLISDKQIEFNNIIRGGDPLNWRADISVLQNWGYFQSVDLKLGINSFIQSN